MRTWLLIFLLFSSIHATEKESATKIIKAIISVISPKQQKVWVDKKNKNISQFIYLKSLNIKENCEDSNVLLLKSDVQLQKACKNLPALVLDYNLLNRYDNAVAAFFWKKGRPNIVFIKDRMKKFEIKLPMEYQIYEEETIW